MPDVQLMQRAVRNLSELISFETVAHPERDRQDQSQFEAQIRALERLYPAVHRTLQRERIDQGGVLFRWAGTQPQGRAVVLMAHLDVVPVDPDDEWKYPAFSGIQAEGYVWGRGALDDKGSVVAILEAVESLLEQGFSPSEDIYLSLGGDEEVGGRDAASVVSRLAERGVRPWLVLDEGGAVASEAFPRMGRGAAMIGLAEKGSMTVALKTRDAGGHSSTPTSGGATARLAAAITRLDRRPFPVSLHPVSARMLELFAAEMKGIRKFLLGRAGLLKMPLAFILPVFGPEANAVVRTTVAVTQLSGSKAANALAAQASATVNLRIAIGSSVAQTLSRLERIIDDPTVRIEILDSAEPSAVSSSDGPQFEVLAETIREIFPDVAVVPYLAMAMTDSRYFCAISDAVYRFTPFRMSGEERAALHAANERISVQTLSEGISFYRSLLGKLA